MGIHLYRKLTTIIIILAMLTVNVPASFAVSSSSVDKAYLGSKKTVSEVGDLSGWNEESAWIVLGLARAGHLNKSKGLEYKKSILETVRKNSSPIINQRQSSDNARAVIALTACGYDPTDLGGYDLTESLADMGLVMKQGINGPVWTLIALDTCGYDICDTGNAKKQVTREKLTEVILSSQKKDGGWSFSGKTSDVDMTCMVLQALAPYYKSDEKCRDAADRALSWLSSVQKDNGAFTSGGNETSESASQVIVALTALGKDPVKDSRFLKKGKGALDSLLSFYMKEGGFKHVSTNYKVNNMATIQGFYALVAYYRFKDGKNSLYDMSDRYAGYKISVKSGGGNDGKDPEGRKTPDKTDNNKDDERDGRNDNVKQEKNDKDTSGNGSFTASEKSRHGQDQAGTSELTGVTKHVNDDSDDDPSEKDKKNKNDKDKGKLTGAAEGNLGRAADSESVIDDDAGAEKGSVSPWLYVIIAAAIALAAVAVLRIRTGKGS